MFRIGQGRLQFIINGGVYKEAGETRRHNSSAISAEDLEAFKSSVEEIEKEPGYPCAHRRMKLYIDDPKFKSKHDINLHYIKNVKSKNRDAVKKKKPLLKIMRPKTFYRYLKAYFPQVTCKPQTTIIVIMFLKYLTAGRFEKS